MLDDEVFIKSCDQVVDEVQEQLGITVADSFVSQQMHALGLKYKKVKRIAF